MGECRICHGADVWRRGKDMLCCWCHPNPAVPPLGEVVWYPAPGWKRGTDLKRLKGVIYDDNGMG